MKWRDLTTVRNTDETTHPRKIIVPIDIDLAELEGALGKAGFALFGKGEYVRLRRIPECIIKRKMNELILERSINDGAISQEDKECIQLDTSITRKPRKRMRDVAIDRENWYRARQKDWLDGLG